MNAATQGNFRQFTRDATLERDSILLQQIAVLNN